jgi:tungstate transport system substrate-binding protein
VNARAALLLLTAIAWSHGWACTGRESPHRIALATTTSVDHSGLLGVLLPAFRSQTGIDVKLVTPGSGIALNMLTRGDVDAVISHAPGREADVLGDGREWWYRKIMFNDFVIAGPPNDPADVKGARSVEDAMRRIAESDARFISRGDSSGTHERERELWSLAGVVPSPERVVVAGSGMGATLRIAAALRAYTLTDRATLGQHAWRSEFIIVFEGGPGLLNTYAVMVRPNAPGDARRFAEWLAEGEGRLVIAEHRTAGGVPAFTVWPADCPREAPGALPCSPAGREFLPAQKLIP